MTTIPSTRPVIIDQYEALLRRLPQSHVLYQQVEHDYRLFLAGYSGESSVQFYYPLLPEGCFILQQLRLSDSSTNQYFQIDLLIGTPYFLYIGEIKNMTGRLVFQIDRGQLLQRRGDEERAVSCPLQQTARQAEMLKRKIKNSLPALPIEAHVISSNANAIIEAPDEEERIYHAAKLPEMIRKLYHKYPRKQISKQQLQQLLIHLKQESTDKRDDLLKKYKLQPIDIMESMYCESCSGRLIREFGTWRCQQCMSTNRESHAATLRDLSLLLSEPLPMQAFAMMMGQPPMQLVRRLLKPFVIRHGHVYSIIQKQTQGK
ncbi:nuclease-related domain-containing protein [Alkalicoccus luteus]|uniref:nuclease-related domain-containing protein n=1 Tax=Alkalicoccus luteus TaxID=1237094 RepID=UPI004033160D